jgi:hypothetical protein
MPSQLVEDQKALKMMKKDGASFKGNNVLCKACEDFKHIVEKCHTIKHRVALYHKSLGRTRDFNVWELDMKLTSPS